MSKYRSLATVSAIALTAGFVTSAQAATDPNLLIDLDSPSIQTDGAAAAAVIASVSVNGSLAATSAVQGPDVFSGLNDIGGGANVSALVDTNTIFALTIGNDVANEADPGAATGVSPDNGLIVGTVSANLGGTLDAIVIGGLILNDVEDAGPGNILSTSSNTISATVEGNALESFIGRDIAGGALVDGDVPDGYTSGEQGQITIDDTGFGNSDLNAGGREIEASGSYTVGSVQFNSGLTDADAVVNDTRIALQAVANDDTTEILTSALDVSFNTIEAAIDGNNSVNAIDLTAGDPTGFDGSASVANLQANAFNDTTFVALVDDVVIEAGDGFTGGSVPIADLDGTTLDVNNNRILATASANTTDNEINIASGISITGPNATAAAQDNSLDLDGASAMNLEGDLIIANAQASDTGFVAEIDESVISVFVESLTNAPVNLNTNEIAANSVMNDAANDITVGGATTFDAVVGISNLQYATADSEALVTTVVIADIADGEDVTASAINVNDNRLTGSATGNQASSVASVTATNIDVASLAGDSFIDGRENDTAEVIADFSVLSAQVVEGATVLSDVEAELTVNISEDGEVDSNQISVSRNVISSQAIGNRVTENGLDIDAGATFSGTAGVLSSQNLIGGAEVDATLDDAGPTGNDIIAVRIGEGDGTLVTADAIDVDSNTISVTVIGNLVDATTNALNIDGTTITDGGQAGTFGPSGFVGRAVGGFVDGTPNVATDSGFGIVTDQLVADGDVFNVTLDLDSGDGANAIQVDVGSTEAAVSAASISVDDNRVALSGTLNQAATEANIGSDGTTSIDGSTSLVNAQSVIDADGDDSSANLNVFLDFGGDIQLEVESNDTDPLTGSAISASNNEISAAGRINVATNSVTVSAVNQILTAIDPTFDPVTGQASSQAPNDISAFGETTLVNDQYAAGANVDADNPFVLVSNGESGGDDAAGVELIIETDGGDVVADSIDVDGNQITNLASVNTASNEINLNVLNFDLSAADDGGGARNGPVATLVSMQRTVELEGDGTVRSLISDSDVLADLDNVEGSVTGAAISVDNNVLRSQASANTVSNTLNVAGTTFVNPTTSDPTAQVGDVALFGLRDFVFSDTTFAVGSVQSNAFVVDAILENSDFEVQVDVGEGTIDGAGLSASGNRLTAEASGNNAFNTASTDFTSNHAGMMVVNFQSNEVAAISASVNPGDPAGGGAATEIQIDAVGADNPDISNTSLTVDNNAILALANGSTATNRIDVDGGSLLGSGLEAATDPSIVVDATVAAPALITANADVGVVSLQTGDGLNAISALVDEAQISVNADVLLDGVSVAVTGNQIGAQAVFQTATNVIDADLSANVGGADDEPTIALVNGQVGSATVTATVIDANIGSTEADDPGDLIDTSDVGAASLTVDNNALVAFAEGARSTNLLSVVAGANIEGDPDRQTGTAPVLTVAGPLSTDEDSIYTADFTLLNFQVAAAPVTAIIQPDASDDNVDTTGIGIVTQAGAVNDSYTVDNNLINARALGVVGNNVLLMDAGATSSATAQLGNGQSSLGSVTATIDGSNDPVIAFGASLDGDVTTSSLSVDNNQMAAVAQANTASNILLASATSGFQESSGLSFETDDGNGDRVVTNADIVVFNQQDATTLDFGGGPIFGDEVSSSITDAAAGIDLGAGGALDSATLSVDGNVFSASSIANDAVNAVALNSDLSARPSVAVISIQTTQDRVVTATTSNVTIGITGVTGAANSSSSVSGNRVGATAVGNRSFSSIGQ